MPPIRYWRNKKGKWNWHAYDVDNGEICFGSVQGYNRKATMMRYLMKWFAESLPTITEKK